MSAYIFWRRTSARVLYDLTLKVIYLTTIPLALLGYWLRAHEGERNNCFSKIQLAGQKYRDKTALAIKRDSAAIVWVFKAGAFRD